MLAVQLGSSSRSAKLFLAGCVIAALAFGWLWLTQRDWVAAAFCWSALVGAARMGLLLRRRHRLQSAAGTVAYGRTLTRALDDSMWVSFARYVVGGRTRDGVILIGPASAAFLPITSWSHIAWEMLKAPFVTSFRFVDLAIEPAHGGDVDAGLRDAVRRHEGFVIDETWSYSHAQRWLVRRESAGIVWIERALPDAVTSRWIRMPPPSIERYLWIRNRIVSLGAAVLVVLVLGGVVAWRASGDADYLVAALAYATLLGASMVAGVVLAKRRLGIETHRQG